VFHDGATVAKLTKTVQQGLRNLVDLRAEESLEG